jgi:hypothetical protein
MNRLILLALALAISEGVFPVTLEFTWRSYISIFLLLSCVLTLFLRRESLLVMVIALITYAYYIYDLWIAVIKFPNQVSSNLILYVSIISVIWALTSVTLIRLIRIDKIEESKQVYLTRVIIVSLAVPIFVLLIIRNYH